MKKLGFIFILLLNACVSISPQDHKTAAEFEQYGLTPSLIRPNNVFVAGLLNIVPGLGNLYLSAGDNGDSDQASYGIMNFFTMPFSFFWSVPQAVIDAYSLNKKAFVDYYSFSTAGIQCVDDLKKQQQTSTLSYQEDYNQDKIQ